MLKNEKNEIFEERAPGSKWGPFLILSGIVTYVVFVLSLIHYGFKS